MLKKIEYLSLIRNITREYDITDDCYTWHKKRSDNFKKGTFGKYNISGLSWILSPNNVGITYGHDLILGSIDMSMTYISMFVNCWYSLNKKGKRYQIFVRMAGQTSR